MIEQYADELKREMKGKLLGVRGGLDMPSDFAKKRFYSSLAQSKPLFD